MASRSDKTPTTPSNRLSREKSPYLLQHAHNPVDWYPWGDEALKLSKEQNKPIFLSIGYSTCHWCHVMAHESFENPQVAELMNKHFVNIKVDREERPDVDALYMTAVQALTGSGGWPMSVWLTPDLKPFYGGTYFPPDDRYGRPGFKTVLIQLAEVWEKDRDRVWDAAKQITLFLNQSSEHLLKPQGSLPDSDAASKAAFEGLQAIYDPKEGGFGPAPKFPMPVYMDFLLHYYSRTQQPAALAMVRHTMEKIARGGIYDQLGGGFARYSTDEKWIVPHFEKMLYDNAQLLSVAVSLYQLTKDPFYAQLIRRTAGYLLRDMRHPDGGFYSAEDADSEGKEGAFYLWTLNEIKKHLEEPAASIFIDHYGITVQGNFFDPHTRETGKNVLVETQDVSKTASKFGMTPEEADRLLSSARQTLFNVRNRRPRPHLDDKILTEWNGLMISALSRAGRALNEPLYQEAAQGAAFFIEKNLREAGKNQLYRRWRDGERHITAQQADYAMLIQGLLDLFETTGRVPWLRWAIHLQETQDRLFFDAQQGGYFMNVSRDDLILRLKDDGDNVIPSGNSVAVANGLRLALLTGRSEFRHTALETIKAFANAIQGRPSMLCKMLTALDFEMRGSRQVVIVGPLDRPDTRHLLSTVYSLYLPNAVVLHVDPEKNQKELAKMLPWVGPMHMVQDRATAYICLDYVCKEPTTDAAVIKKQLS